MVLDNKLGITDSLELAKAEEKISKEGAKALFEQGLLETKEAGCFETLAFIHKTLFQDIYECAGQIRDVNMAKGNFRFAPVMHLSHSLKMIDKMPQSTVDEILEKYVEMNIVHPFREGNGRSMRLWLDHLLKAEVDQVVDWSKVDKEDYLLVMERSPIRDIENKNVIKQALTSKVKDRTIYLKGIDHSYYYEGYSLYKTEGL